jgi:hypothetical protein
MNRLPLNPLVHSDNGTVKSCILNCGATKSKDTKFGLFCLLPPRHRLPAAMLSIAMVWVILSPTNAWTSKPSRRLLPRIPSQSIYTSSIFKHHSLLRLSSSRYPGNDKPGATDSGGSFLRNLLPDLPTQASRMSAGQQSSSIASQATSYSVDELQALAQERAQELSQYNKASGLDTPNDVSEANEAGETKLPRRIMSQIESSEIVSTMRQHNQQPPTLRTEENDVNTFASPYSSEVDAFFEGSSGTFDSRPPSSRRPRKAQAMRRVSPFPPPDSVDLQDYGSPIQESIDDLYEAARISTTSVAYQNAETLHQSLLEQESVYFQQQQQQQQQQNSSVSDAETNEPIVQDDLEMDPDKPHNYKRLQALKALEEQMQEVEAILQQGTTPTLQKLQNESINYTYCPSCNYWMTHEDVEFSKRFAMHEAKTGETSAELVCPKCLKDRLLMRSVIGFSPPISPPRGSFDSRPPWSQSATSSSGKRQQPVATPQSSSSPTSSLSSSNTFGISTESYVTSSASSAAPVPNRRYYTRQVPPPTRQTQSGSPTNATRPFTQGSFRATPRVYPLVNSPLSSSQYVAKSPSRSSLSSSARGQQSGTRSSKPIYRPTASSRISLPRVQETSAQNISPNTDEVASDRPRDLTDNERSDTVPLESVEDQPAAE